MQFRLLCMEVCFRHFLSYNSELSLTNLTFFFFCLDIERIKGNSYYCGKKFWDNLGKLAMLKRKVLIREYIFWIASKNNSELWYKMMQAFYFIPFLKQAFISVRRMLMSMLTSYIFFKIRKYKHTKSTMPGCSFTTMQQSLFPKPLLSLFLSGGLSNQSLSL